MSFYKFTPISEEEGRHYRQVFYDATVYIELEDEDEPVRVMCTAFRMPDGQYYELKLMISILERDDMVEAMLWYLGALFLLFLICTSIGIQLVLKGVFRPLHRLLDWLHCIQPGKEVPPLDNPTKIREFPQKRPYKRLSYQSEPHSSYRLLVSFKNTTFILKRQGKNI